MVIGHDPILFQENQSHNDSKEPIYIPAPRLDRLAANIIDFFIVFMISKILAAKSILILKVALNFELNYTFFANVFNVLWLSFSVYLIYVVLTYKFLGSTIGQRFFSVKIISNDEIINLYKDSNTKKYFYLSYYTLVLRSLLIFISLFFMIPIVGVFFNRKGRAFYDKVTDTLVVSYSKLNLKRHSESHFKMDSLPSLTKLTSNTNRQRVDFYFPMDKFLGSVFILILFSAATVLSMHFIDKSFKFKNDFSGSSKVCQNLNPYHESWVESGLQESRLDVAVALYSAGELSVNCLSKEIDFEFSLNSSNPTAYFAKGLLSFENEELVLKYFKKSCSLDPFSSACQVSTWISLWPHFSEGESVAVDFENHPTFYKIWLVKRFHQKGMLLRLQQSLDQFSVQKGLEGFYAEHMMRVELFKNSNQNFSSMLKLTQNLSPRSKKLTQSFCGIMVAKNCDYFEKHQECQDILSDQTSDNHLQNMRSACLKNERKIFSSDTDHEAFYRSISRSQPNLIGDLKSIFMNSKNSFSVRYTSLIQFFESKVDLKTLDLITEDWLLDDSKDFFWRLIGEGLKKKYIEFGQIQKSFDVYKALVKEFEELNFNDNLNDKLINDFTLRTPAQTLNQKKGK